MIRFPRSHIHRLKNPVRGYAWGSRTAIAELQGRDPSASPEAELWLGAHESASSEIEIGDAWHPLDQVIAAHPRIMLGQRAETETNLPFLMKVLAAAKPLSLQAHPDADQAEAGFAAEERRGMARTSRRRNYPDRHHKPEVIYALTPFTILRGFRSPSRILELFGIFALADFPPLVALRDADDAESGLEGFLRAFLELPQNEIDATVRHLRATIRGRGDDEAQWIHRLLDEYPGDRGAMAPLFLHLFQIAPGEAVFTGAGVLHAYLEGVGVEVMAASDNVLRGALTAKHVDVGELLRVVRYETQEPRTVTPRADGAETIFDTPAEEFRLSEIRLAADEVVELPRTLQILLVAEGDGHLETVSDERADRDARRGDSFYVRPGGGGLRLHGPLRAFRATLGGGVGEGRQGQLA